jgi:MFS family permease
MATFMAAVESTIVATAMLTIVAELGDFHLFSWVFAAYLLTQAVSIPIYGRLADLYGRKRMFYLGAGLFLTGSVLCGFAWGMIPLIAFRFIQGIGAGAVQPIAYVIVADIYTPTERARVQGLLSGMFGIAAVIGPPLGGLMVQRLSWSYIFWISVLCRTRKRRCRNKRPGRRRQKESGLVWREALLDAAHELIVPARYHPSFGL